MNCVGLYGNLTLVNRLGIEVDALLVGQSEPDDTVHGREAVVVIAAEEFRRLKGDLTGQALIDAIQASPYRDTQIESTRSPLPIRDVAL